MTIKVVLQPGAHVPEYQTEGAAGADVRAFLNEPIELKPLERCAVQTGIALEIPVGFEVQVRPRSGLALKHGITCLNTPGTIDSDYRGEVRVILINLGTEPFVINNGDRIAQLVAAPVAQARFSVSDSLSSTERGMLGFGSTGAK